MNAHDLDDAIDHVRRGQLSRRVLIRRLVGLGLSAPAAVQLLALGGVAHAQEASRYKPTRAGGGGTLKLLWWQGPSLLNPHFAAGTADQDGSRLFYEPLAAWDPQGELRPILAAELPSRENGGLSADGLTVVWKLKPNVRWHDGHPFTADDVVFNWAFARDPASAAVTIGTYAAVSVEKIDDHTVRVVSDKPMPFWADAFVGYRGMLIPKHLFEGYAGSKSREAPTNLRPVGTGPYLYKEFRSGDLVSGARNPDYHQPNRPYFDALEMKSGGDAISAARTVLQTGEYDLAWNLQVEEEVLKRLEAAGKGTIRVIPGGQVEFIQLNATNPNTEVHGERSSLKTTHPSLSDPAVRQALAMLVDRDSVRRYIYGRGGDATANIVNNPARYRSASTRYEFSVEKAAELLDKAGWKPGPDGIRAKGGRQLKFVYQTSINGPRQKTQQIVKQACRKAGIEIEIKAVVGSVFFSSDEANPDTYGKFYADMQMITSGAPQPDPHLWLSQFLSTECAQKSNKWQGRNICRWRNEEFDAVFKEAGAELDPSKRAALLIRLNDIVIRENAVIPVITRPGVAAVANRLQAELSGFDGYLWDLASWYREA